MSDADRMNLAYIEEVTFGTTPSTPAFKDLRFTSESIAQITGTVNSAEIRSDRQIVDHIRTTINVAGDVNVELSFSAFDDFLEAGLLSADFTAEISLTATDISADNSDNSINSVAAAFTHTINRWIKISGFLTNATNNGFARIATATTSKLTLVGITLITEAAGDSVTVIQGAEIKNGTEQRFFTFQKEYTDITEFARYTGCEIDTFTFTVPSDNIVTGTFGILGKIETSAQTAIAGATSVAAPANEVMAGIEDITAILEANVAFPSTEFSITLGNNLRQRLQIGSLGPISIGTGVVEVTGTLQAYFDSAAILDKYLNFTDSSLAIQFADSTGKGYVIDLPRVNYDTGTRVAGGQNTDIIVDLSFSAFRNSTQNETIVIQRFLA